MITVESTYLYSSTNDEDNLIKEIDKMINMWIDELLSHER